MTDPQLRKIYRRACDGKGFEPNEGQFKLWKQTLGWCEEEDLAQGLVWYFEANTSFPMPAELKPLSERARRERIAKNSGPAIQTVWQCEDCGHTVSSLDPEWRPLECQGFKAVPLKHADYGLRCFGRNWKIGFQCEVGKKPWDAAAVA